MNQKTAKLVRRECARVYPDYVKAKLFRGDARKFYQRSKSTWLSMNRKDRTALRDDLIRKGDDGK